MSEDNSTARTGQIEDDEETDAPSPARFENVRKEIRRKGKEIKSLTTTEIPRSKTQPLQEQMTRY